VEQRSPLEDKPSGLSLSSGVENCLERADNSFPAIGNPRIPSSSFFISFFYKTIDNIFKDLLSII